MGVEPQGREVTAAAALMQARALASANPARIATAVIALTVLGLAIELAAADPGDAGFSLILFGAHVFFQHDVTWTALSSAGLVPAGYRVSRVAGVLGVYLLTSLGIMLGFLLLVIPGIILSVRWAIAVPILIGDDAGIIESIGRSWRETSGHFWPILGTILVAFVPAILAVVVAELMLAAGADPFLPALIANSAYAAASVIWWLAAVAIYQYAAPRSGLLADVFA